MAVMTLSSCAAAVVAKKVEAGLVKPIPFRIRLYQKWTMYVAVAAWESRGVSVAVSIQSLY